MLNLRFKKNRSLLTNLFLWYAISAFFLVSLSTVYLYWSLVKTLNRQDSELLSDRLETIRVLLISSHGDFTDLKRRIETEWTERKFERLYARIIDSEGKIVAQTPGLSQWIDAIFDSNSDLEYPKTNQPSLNVNGDEPAIRAVHTLMTGPDGKLISVRLAVDRTHEALLLSRYRYRLFIVLALAILVSMLVGQRIASHAVRPINQMSETAARIGSSNLHERISQAGMPVELAYLGKTFNEMMDRLTESFSRLSLFSADIAHELRSPINNLAGELEVALSKTRDPAFYRDVMGSALEECQRITHIIDSLLFLARSEDPKTELQKEELLLDKELRNVLDFYEPAALEAGVTCSLEATQRLVIRAERTLFQRAIGNVISNAIKHTPPSGSLTIKATQINDRACIEIKDTGHGIAKEHLPYIFDRLYRVDRSRSKNSGGTGLGLAIVKSIVSIHEGSVELTSEPNRGTCVRFLLPIHSGGPVLEGSI